jgi:hypothetical protein
MNRFHRVKAVAKRREFDFALWATIGFFGLLPIALGVSLGLAQFFQLFH